MPSEILQSRPLYERISPGESVAKYKTNNSKFKTNIMMDIDEIKKQIISAFLPYEPEKIILFGSITRDDWDEYSDVDVIVVYETDKSFLERLKELYMSWDIPKAIDILAYTPAEFIEMTAENFFIQDAVTDGELIYERE